MRQLQIPSSSHLHLEVSNFARECRHAIDPCLRPSGEYGSRCAHVNQSRHKKADKYLLDAVVMAMFHLFAKRVVL